MRFTIHVRRKSMHLWYFESAHQFPLTYILDPQICICLIYTETFYKLQLKDYFFFFKPKQVSIAKRASLYMYTTIHAISLKVVWMWLSLAVYAGNRTYHKYAKLVSSSKVFVVWFLNSLILVLCKASNFIPIYLISSIFLFASCIIHIHDRIKFGDKLVCT